MSSSVPFGPAQAILFFDVAAAPAIEGLYAPLVGVLRRVDAMPSTVELAMPDVELRLQTAFASIEATYLAPRGERAALRIQCEGADPLVAHDICMLLARCIADHAPPFYLHVDRDRVPEARTRLARAPWHAIPGFDGAQGREKPKPPRVYLS